jgi:multidrug efflux pump subunit AcrB
LPKDERDRPSHAIALELRQLLAGLDAPDGTAIKVVEPPPGPPVLATLLAEIYGPDAETRRAVATRVREAFASVDFIVDVDDSFGEQAQRLRLAIDQDNLEFYKVEQRDVYDTISAYFTGRTVGYSHRGGGRQPIPIRVALPKGEKFVGEQALATPVPANALPGGRDIVELGDVVTISREPSSFPVFRHNGRAAEMVTAELAGAFEAPVYGMIAVADAIEEIDWGDLEKPQIRLHGQPEDEARPVLLWDGEWEVTWVTFRDMGAAFMVALLGIYILVVAQFGSFKLPLVILTPIPLTFIGIMFGHWLFAAPFTATSMIGFIALAGIIVRNSILLVDFIRHARAPDRPLVDVLLEAGALFGLASSTALTVLVIPAIYVALRGEGHAKLARS